MAYIFEVGWAFFAAWGMVLLAMSVVAFGRDLNPLPKRNPGEKRH
jgi:hypothetical protein